MNRPIDVDENDNDLNFLLDIDNDLNALIDNDNDNDLNPLLDRPVGEFERRQRRSCRYVCRACLVQFTDAEFRRNQNEALEFVRLLANGEQRCRICTEMGRRPAKTIDQQPVSSFMKEVFGKQEHDRFVAWIRRAPQNLLHIFDDDADYDREINVFDRILQRYEPFQELCRQVDPLTHLYPLQNAAVLGIKWEEVRSR